MELYRGVGRALRFARAQGWLVVCVTNQSGIERGFYTSEDVERIHSRLNARLSPEGAHVDAFYYCPHAPERGCACRKPGTLLFEQAAHALSIDLAASAIVGDRVLDAEAGRRLGLLVAQVRTPDQPPDVAAEFPRRGIVPDISAESFEGAVIRVVARG